MIVGSDKISVDYLEKDIVNRMEGSPTDFMVSIENIWYKIRGEVKYLKIEHSSGQVIKQFMIKNIDEKLFAEILSLFACARTKNFASKEIIPDLGTVKMGKGVR